MITAVSQTKADIRLAIRQVGMGSSIDIPKVIPLSIMKESASVSSRNGQTSTTNSKDAGAALDLERSATIMCRAVEAIAKSNKARDGTQSHFKTSIDVSESIAVDIIIQETYDTGIGRKIEAAVMEYAGLAMGPTIAFHHRPESDSSSLDTIAGDDTETMKPGAKTSAASKLLS